MSERPELKQALGRLLGPAGPELGSSGISRRCHARRRSFTAASRIANL